MTGLPLSNGVPETRRRSRKPEKQGTGRRLARDALPGNRVPEESDGESHLDLVLSGLPVESAVEREKLIEGRELDRRSGQDREVGECRRAAGRHHHSPAESLVRRNAGPPVRPGEVNRVTVDDRVG